MQSTDDEELKRIGRVHDYRTFCNAYEMARRAGFGNINVDLMAALPGQTVCSYRRTLERVLSLRPEHISAYSLILEEGTWLHAHRDELAFPSEDEDRAFYELTGKLLAENNYMRYEISNYAQPGYECRHNQVYWTRGDYVGFGPGAASMVNDVRWSNPRSMPEYREAVRRIGSESAEKQYLSRQEQMEEFMLLGLRLTRGVRKQDFQEKFGLPIEAVYGEILEELRRDGLLIVEDAVRLTPYGTDISNYVMAKFLFG